MFGYLRIHREFVTKELMQAYSQYYCGICFALYCNYGFLSRFILSYDITLIAILGKLYENIPKHRMFCLSKKEKLSLYFNKDWKTIAGTSILLFAEKLQDDINDDNSILAKIANLLFSKCIEKARNDFPVIHSIIDYSYKKIVSDEKEKLDVLSISEDFAQMMLNVSENIFSLSYEDTIVLKGISRWLYFIDALDDYDKDLKKRRFNPLLIPKIKFNEYVSIYYKKIYSILQNILSDINNIEISKRPTNIEIGIINNLIKYTIPVTISMVLNNQPLVKLQGEVKLHKAVLFRRYKQVLSKFPKGLVKTIFRK